MFEQSIVEARGPAARPWSLAASLTGQVALVGLAILIPMMHPEMLQKVSRYIPVVSPPAGPVPVRRADVTRAVAAPRPRIYDMFDFLTAPAKVPHGVSTLPDEPAPAGLAEVSGPGVQGIGSGYASQIITDIARQPLRVEPRPAAPEVKPIPKPRAAASAPIRQGGDVQAALLVFGPKPVYPALAKQARIQGSVHLAAVIGSDGKVIDLRAIDGHPLLVGAAIDAVKRWIYRPTLLNGEPVEVVTEITVTFTLQ